MHKTVPEISTLLDRPTHGTAEPREDPRPAALLVFFLTMALVFLMAARSPLDSDLFWHLRAGQETVQLGRPVLNDMLSFTRLGAAWTNHSWLAQVFLYGLYRWGGFFAIGGLVAILATVSMGFVYASMHGPVFMRAFLVILASVVAAYVWSARPQVFSLALLAAVGWLLYRYKWKKKNELWALIPIFILWSNLHAGYVLGILLLGAFIGGELFNRLTWNDGAGLLTNRELLHLTGWSGLSVLAVLVNPNGINTWLVPFRTVEVGAIQKLISEWASPDFHEIGQQSMLILFLLGLVAFCLSRRRVDGTDLLPFILFGYLAFVARRNFGPFALIAAPAVSRSLWPAAQSWWEEFSLRFPQVQAALEERVKSAQRKSLPGGVRKGFNLGLVGIFTLFAIVKLYAVSCPPIMGMYLPQYFPTRAAAWISDHHPSGPMFNSYDWGGYFTWSLPEYPVFIDGRTDLFNDELIDEWLQVVNVQPGWQQVLDRWKIRLVVLEPGRPLSKILAAQGWKLDYQDEQAVILSR
jgi:hypothetical protein